MSGPPHAFGRASETAASLSAPTEGDLLPKWFFSASLQETTVQQPHVRSSHMSTAQGRHMQGEPPLMLLGDPTWRRLSRALLLERSQAATLARTRGLSGWVLRATMSSSCCWSALTAGSPEEGSGLPEVVVLEELSCMSLRMGETEALVTWQHGGHLFIRHSTGVQETPSAGGRSRSALEVAWAEPPSGRGAHFPVLQAARGRMCHGEGR